MDARLAEPISPELVLVTPELRALALRELDTAEADAESSAADGPSDEPSQEPSQPVDRASRRSLLAQLALYAGWQAVTGALFGLAAFVVFAALLILKPFIH